MKASTHKLVTAGWAYGIDGKEPSGCCSEAKNARARSTDLSTRRHSSEERTFDGVSLLRSANTRVGTAGMSDRTAVLCCARSDAAVVSSATTRIKMMWDL